MVTDAGIEMSVHGDSSISWIPVGNGLRERLVKSGNVFPFRLRLSRMPGRRNGDLHHRCEGPDDLQKQLIMR